MAFVHGAGAYKFECALALRSREHDRVFENWVGRNEHVIDRIDAVGRAAQWFNADGFGPAEAWSRMIRRDAARTQRYIAEQIGPNPREACANAAAAFEAGDLDLTKFPEDLKTLGVKWP